jgi:hypothetical protein
MTAGGGTNVMEQSHDEPTPPDIQTKVIDAFKPKDDED